MGATPAPLGSPSLTSHWPCGVGKRGGSEGVLPSATGLPRAGETGSSAPGTRRVQLGDAVWQCGCEIPQPKQTDASRLVLRDGSREEMIALWASVSSFAKGESRPAMGSTGFLSWTNSKLILTDLFIPADWLPHAQPHRKSVKTQPEGGWQWTREKVGELTDR